MSTLHLISVSSPLCGASLLHALHQLGQEVALLGLPEPTTAEFPHDLRVRFTSPTSGHGGARALRKHLASGSPFEVLFCWDDGAYEAGQGSRPSKTSILKVPDDLLTVPPAISTRTAGDRVAARDALGISQDRLVLLPLGSNEVVNAFEIVRIAGILAYAGEPITLLLPQRAQQIERASRFLSLHKDDWQTIVIPQTTMLHFYAANAAIISPSSLPNRRDSLACLQSDAILAGYLGLRTVGSDEIAEQLKPLPIDGVPTNATMPETARAVRSALHATSPQGYEHQQSFTDWARALESFISAGVQAAVQGC